jgi:hypothetical protein
MCKKIIYISLLFFIPITLLGSNRRQDALYDNGILGRGFVQKSEASLRREEILAQTRNENALNQCRSEQVQTKFDWGCASLLYTALQAVVFGVPIFFENCFIDKKTEKVFVCNPVIKSIISVPFDTVSLLGGTVQFRSKLHHLRKRFDSKHMTQRDERFYFSYDSDNELFGIKDDLIKYPSGIMVKYTDGQLVRISYNQRQDCCEYSVKKRK